MFGVEVQGQYVFLGCIDCGSSKKDAFFLTDVASRFLTDESFHAGFGPFVNAYITDGAAACKLSALSLQQGHHVIFVRCQLHAMGLVLKHIFSSIDLCKTTSEKAERVIDLFLSNNRLRSLLKDFSKGKALLRFVPVRIAIHVIALRRLIQLKSALYATCNDKSFGVYVAEQRDEKRIACLAVKDIVEDKDFWRAVEFCVDGLTPIVITLRIIDSSCKLAGYIHFLWSLIRATMETVFGRIEFTWVPVTTTQGILSIVEDDYLKECSHVFDAAYVLNPHFYDSIFELATSRDDADRLEWDDLRRSTLMILELAVKRDLHVRGKPEIFLSTFSTVQIEFQQFYFRRGPFERARPVRDGEDPEMWWDAVTSVQHESNSDSKESDPKQNEGRQLAAAAIAILNVGHAVSNVERNHKVTSLIHTDTRNRLRHEMVNILTRGNLAYRNARVSKRARFEFWRSKVHSQLISVSEKEEADLARYAEMVNAAVQTTTATLSDNTRNDEIGLACGEPVPLESENRGDADCDEEVEPATARVAAQPSVMDEEESEEAASQQMQTRSGRISRPPRWLKEALLTKQ